MLDAVSTTINEIYRKPGDLAHRKGRLLIKYVKSITLI